MGDDADNMGLQQSICLSSPDWFGTNKHLSHSLNFFEEGVQLQLSFFACLSNIQIIKIKIFFERE